MSSDKSGSEPIDEFRPPIVWYPIIAMLVFVFFYGLFPSDPRIRMGLKPFEPEFDLSASAIWYSVKKWRHILWFAAFFPLVRSLFKDRANLKAFSAVLLVSFFIELEECFSAGRYGRLTDFLPNLMGAGLSGGLIKWWAWLTGSSSKH